MANYKSDFLNTLDERGFIHQATDLEGLDKVLSNGAIHTAYIGFDCTAPSLHIGSLVQIMMLRHFQKCGHKPIALMGGGTTKVGDPSGKDASRKILDNQTILSFVESITDRFSHFLTIDNSATGAIVVNNDDWLSPLKYIDFLREIGPHFTINRMMTFDSVKLRLDREQPLTFLEFNYMILQAYDFMELNKRYGCRLQLGGSDQWGNIVNGMELARRINGAELFGVTTPLITTADGKKMGKTEKGAIWLNEAQLPAYEYWQFWRNTQDSDVGKFLRLFTELPLSEIKKLEALQGQEINEAKKILADEATTICRGAEAAKKARATAEETFEANALGADLPTIDVSKKDIHNGVLLIDALVDAGLCQSKKEAKRLMQQGGAKVNDVSISDESYKLSEADFTDQAAKLSAGKKKHIIIRQT